MPYWSSSRVGAVPQGQPTKHKKRTERYNRKKGITMEDLKKQTAIRLAQEQQQGLSASGNAFPRNTQERSTGVVQPQPTRQASYNASKSSHGAHSAPFHPNSQIVSAPATPKDHYHSNVVASNHNKNNSSGAQSILRGSNGVLCYRYDQNHGSSSSSCSLTYVEEHVSTPVKKQPSSRSYHQSEPRRTAPRPTKSSSSDASGTKAKLPHGLTVHELKEMTKARLQAEATEKRDLSSPEPVGPIPSVVRATPEYPERHASSPSPIMPSPPPSNFGRNSRSPYPESNFQTPLESWSHDSRNDLWETGSVSTQTSDYIGSEQAFRVASFNCEENTGYNRARSFSANSGQPTHEFGPSRDAASPAMGQSQASPYFGDSPSSFVPNRRRAATLSPRLGLSHLHEDRPVLHGQNLPGLPLFHGGSFVPPIAPKPSSSVLSTVGPLSASDQFTFTTTTPGVIGGTHVEGNRARTSSAVSLPAMSHTADEFALDQNNSSSRLSQFGALSEYIPGSSSVTGLSDVFRESPVPAASAPPGFIVGSDLRCPPPATSNVGIGGVDSLASQPRARASTWCEPTTSSVSLGLFGPGLISVPRQDDLADDLASILKLSGAEEKDTSLLSPPPCLM